MLTCPFCRNPVSPDQAGVYRLVTGWVEARRGGGANQIRLASAPKAFAHKFCIDRAVRGFGPKQSERCFPRRRDDRCDGCG